MNEMVETLLPVALVFDSKYAEFSIVLIENIRNKTAHFKGFIFYLIMDVDVDYSYQEKFLKKINANYEMIRVKRDDYSEFLTSGHISTGAYYIFSIIENLPIYYPTVLYMDVDVYVNCDITDIFRLTSKSHSLTVVDSFIDNYFGSGLFLINTKLANEKFNLKYLGEIYEANRNNILWHDQDVLNIAFKDDYIKIPPIWDFLIQDYLFNKKKYHHAGYEITDAKIIHFAGTSKPWRFSTNLPFADNYRSIYKSIYNKQPWNEVTIREFIIYFITLSPIIFYLFIGLKKRLNNAVVWLLKE